MTHQYQLTVVKNGIQGPAIVWANASGELTFNWCPPTGTLPRRGPQPAPLESERPANRN